MGESSLENPNPSGSDGKRRMNHVKSGTSNRLSLSSTSRGENDATKHAVANTTQEAPDGYPEKTMRIENVENHSLNWVPISSAGALDMTHCDFSVR